MKQLNLFITSFFLFLAPLFAQEKETIAGKSDFIPGENIIFTDDFSTGNSPAQWITNGSGEIVTNAQFPGWWLQMSKAGYYIPQANKKFTDNFTVEFDLVILNSPNKPTVQGIDFLLVCGSLSNPNEGGDIPGNAGIKFSPTIDKLSWANWSDVDEGHKDDGSVPFRFNSAEKYHIAFSVQNQQVRMHVNGKAILDLKEGLVEGYTFNIFRIHTNGEIKPMIANFRIAAGLPGKI